MLPGHRLVGFVLDLHDLAGLFVPLGPLAGLGVLELGAVFPESLNDFLLGGSSLDPSEEFFAIPCDAFFLAAAFTSPPKYPPLSPLQTTDVAICPAKRGFSRSCHTRVGGIPRRMAHNAEGTRKDAAESTVENRRTRPCPRLIDEGLSLAG